MTPLRLLLVTQDLGVGGLERVVATIASTVDRRRFEPAVLCLREGGAFADALSAQGIPVHVLDWKPGRRDYFAFARTARLLRRNRIDVLHTHNTDPFITGGLGRLAAFRSIRHVHTDHARPFPDRWRYMMAERLLSNGCHRVVGVSEHTTENLARWERIPRRKLVTIPNGIDPRPFDRPIDAEAVRASLGVPPGAILAGLGARLTRQKGVDLLLDAMATEACRTTKLHLVIAGDGPERRALERQAVALGLQERVSFLGERLDFVQWLPALDIFAMPSRWEGLPMALLEAMAARTAIVATAVGGIPNALCDGVNAVMVPPESVEPLATALRRLAMDTALRSALGVAARAAFDAGYSARVMTRQYETLYAGEM